MAIRLPQYRSFYIYLFLHISTFFCIVWFLKIGSRDIQNLIHREFNRTAEDFSSDCHWRFDHYSPSLWESFWYNNIDNLQTKVCSTLAQPEHLNKSIRSLDQIIKFQKQLASNNLFNDEDDGIFSKMFYRYECFRSSRKTELIVAQFIEPLIGLIRDPLTICPSSNAFGSLLIQGDAAVQSKRFLLLGPSAPYDRFPSNNNNFKIVPWLYRPGAQKILIDLGASLFNGQDHPTIATQTIGARWFYEYFKSFSLEFDRIIAFEYNEYKPKTYWEQIPDDLIGKFVFINVGVEENGKFNPWNILRTVARQDDYVIVKLDIDTRPLEMVLIDQLVQTTGIASLVDEMFFEMHVTVKEMETYWGRPGGNLKDTFVLFNKLRQLGIRMHSWP